MSKTQYADYSRSVSDGDLAGFEKKKAKEKIFLETDDKQVFFTLPRWMSVRKKKNKLKYIKVDVPFTSFNNERNSEEYDSEDTRNISSKLKNTERSNNFIRKLFRSNSFFSKSSTKNLTKVPTSPTLFSSNYDIRTGASNFQFQNFDTHECFKDKVPAVCGLKNHGNTCFMNAIIQCLSNTDFFAEYFVMDYFKMDLLRRNKAHSKRYGTKGEVTEQLGVLLKSLWSCQYYANISSKFKNSVSKYGSQYEGNEQHDAQEFLLWLLDKVHEDLNIASKEKYKKSKGNMGRSDEDIAAEMLANHLRCNSSFIQDLFQGQFRSSLGCLGCGRFSNTFDPYLCVSLPIPHTNVIPILLYFVSMKEKQKMIKIGVLIDSEASVCDLHDKLNSNLKKPKNNLLLLEIRDGTFQKSFCDSDLISDLNDRKHLYAFEVPARSKNVSMECENITLVIVNGIKNEVASEMIWRPFVLDISREISYSELETEICSAMCHVLKENVCLKELCDMYILINDDKREAMCSSVDMPLYMPAVDKALLSCNGENPHVKISILWRTEAKEMLLTDLMFIDEHSSVPSVESYKRPSEDISLSECFGLYFNEERLESEDAWMCSFCHHRLPCVKSLSLWTIPDVFIVHLKRFRQSSSQRLKITTFVEFPFSGLDMSPYVAGKMQNSQTLHNTSLASMTMWSPWKRSKYRPYSRSEENLYELYAVCNHHGSMQGGHYTAYCRNSVNGHWYHFDDTKVQEVPASEVVSADAYILFYQRTNSMSHSCASSSSSGYSSASSNYSFIPEHWAFRLIPYFRDAPYTSKSQDNLSDSLKTASLDRRTASLDRRANSSHRPFDRSFKTYSSIQPAKAENTFNKLNLTDSNVNYQSPVVEEEIPPPPPPLKQYWTVTSV